MPPANVPPILAILEILLTAEPAIVIAVRNILTGSATTDDLAMLKMDALAWQAIADHAAAELAKRQ